jgi:signal peptidase I
VIGSLLLALTLQQSGPVLVPPGHHPYTVASASMQPGLQEGDVVVADRSRGVCGTTTPTPGDVVIVDRDGTPWIRRIVAGPGQTVHVRGGVLYIDGQAVRRERAEVPDARPFGEDTDVYAMPFTVWRETLASGRSWLTLDLGPDQMLDDTPETRVPQGHWFGMGDNRDNAVDDRVDGPTEASRLCGVVVTVARSAEPSRVGTRP